MALYPVSSTLFTLLVCHACSVLCSERRCVEVMAVVMVRELGEGKATVPIFRHVNELQKQMDLKSEIHLAPLE